MNSDIWFSEPSGSHLAQLIRLLTSAVIVVLLAACGGGAPDSLLSASAGSDGISAGGTSSRSFINWSGNANAQVVKDANDENFAFYSDTGCLYSYNTKTETVNFCLNNVSDPRNASAQFAGISIQVVSVKSTGGGCIAQLVTKNGKLVDIYTNSAGVQTVLETSTNAVTCGSSGDSTSGGATSRGFIAWVGNSNGVIVKDANNEDFSFYSDTRCLYSYALKQETNNFCLGPGATGIFANQAMSVLSVAGQNGGCIAALADPSGYSLDIVTDAAGVQTVRKTSEKWDTTGCTS